MCWFQLACASGAERSCSMGHLHSSTRVRPRRACLSELGISSPGKTIASSVQAGDSLWAAAFFAHEGPCTGLSAHLL
jgi:hypothetical protein